MARVLDAEAIGAYRDDGFICPITMMSPEEARHCRDQLESFEEEHGRVFSDNVNPIFPLRWVGTISRHNVAWKGGGGGNVTIM